MLTKCAHSVILELSVYLSNYFLKQKYYVNHIFDTKWRASIISTVFCCPNFFGRGGGSSISHEKKTDTSSKIPNKYN